MRRQARIRLTKAGWLYAAATLGMGLAAVNTGDNLLYLVVSFLLAAMATASLWAYLNFSALAVEIVPMSPTFRDRPTPVEVWLHNRKRFSSFLVEVSLPEFPEARRWVFHLAPRSVQRVRLRLRFPRRGLYTLQRVRIRSAFPFGLAYREETLLSRPVTVLVYPAVHAVRGDPPASVLAAQSGVQSIAREGAGGDFLGLRTFAPGDSPRRIYWRSFYKEGRLEVKRFGEEASTTAWLRLPPHPAESDVERVASWVVALVNRGYSVGLVVEDTGERFPPRAGEAQKHLLLRALALHPHPLRPSRKTQHRGSGG